jgi:hypothetical protein
MNRFACCLALLSLIAMPVHSYAQDAQSKWFDFAPPWDDATPGSIIDMSQYNTSPAGSNGRIIVRDGKFVESNTGKRVRFLATNTTAWHNFPEKADAQKVAARMAKFGINIVRLHHMDNRWNLDSGSSIWKTDANGALVIDEKQLDKLDYYIAQLKKHGIYVNLNLKVSKVLMAADGMPEGIKDLKAHYHKGPDKFDDKMIEHQKGYAHQMLTHVNPYTGLEYRNDPAVAIVEINNENGLLGGSWGNIGKGLEKLSEPYRSELQTLWNQWLAKTYANDAALQKAWASDAPVQSEPVIASTSKWSLNKQGAAKATLAYPDGQSNGLQSQMHVQIEKSDNVSWHLELSLPQIYIQERYAYTLTFKAKSAKTRTGTLAVMRDREDYRAVGLMTNVKFDPQWKDYSYTFQGSKVDPDHMRLTFKIGGAPDDIWFEDVQITPGSQGSGVGDDASLAKKNIDIPEATTRNQRRDWIRFLVSVEANYSGTMRDYLKKELGVKALIIDSQIDWGGLSGYARESIMDFADVHAYWQHPSFPGKSWDRSNWNIKNTSLVNTWASGNHGTLDRLATLRLTDRPYTVSEYDHPSPSEYASECMPLLATVAATQDWDGVYSFEYGPWNKSGDQNKIANFFDHGSNPAKIAFYPAAAMIFREGLIAPLSSQVTLELPRQAYDQYDLPREAWDATEAKTDPASVLSKRMGMLLDQESAGSKPRLKENASSKTDGNIPQIQKVDDGGIFTMSSQKASVIVGQIGGRKVDAGALILDLKPFEKNFAAATLTAMDRKPISQSTSLLLTVITQARNQNMGWNEAHNSVGTKWGNGPTQVLGVTGSVSIQCAKAMKVYTLDQTGKRDQQVNARFDKGVLSFDISPAQKTVWYELTNE